MKKTTKLSMPWFYELLERGECDIMDFKQQLDDKETFGKSLKNYSSSYDELALQTIWHIIPFAVVLQLFCSCFAENSSLQNSKAFIVS